MIIFILLLAACGSENYQEHPEPIKHAGPELPPGEQQEAKIPSTN
jgi:hypothetical protein